LVVLSIGDILTDIMNLEKYIKVHKNIGETPLEALERVRVVHNILNSVPMTYAGRLDPMAEGLLLVLVGEECKNKEEYLGMDKEYEVEVLFGFSTDTGDLLGKVKSQKLKVKSESQKSKIEEILQSLVGKFEQEYPKFSSKTVEGKPLFAYAKSGELPDELPSKQVEIYDIKFLEERKISNDELLNYIEENIGKVKGDFRQEEILSGWREVLNNKNEQNEIIKIKVNCSSGTYMRLLAEKIGEKLGSSALAFSIRRTRVGEFEL